MPSRTLVLASGSPARLALLRTAGFAPEVVVSGVPEDDVDPSDTAGSVGRLAAAKAAAVARSGGDALVVGCDSMLEFEGRPHGKPASVAEARSWLVAMRGRSGTLWTGHCVIDEATGERAEEVVGTTVRFGVTTDAELDAYLATPTYWRWRAPSPWTVGRRRSSTASTVTTAPSSDCRCRPSAACSTDSVSP